MEREMAVADFVSLVVYSLTFLLGLPSNLLVLAVYVRKACKRGATPCVVYALNLCVSNLALVAWLPVMALETALQSWALPLPVCLVYSFFLFASLYGSCLFLAVTTVGRYLGTAFPISYKLYRSARLSCGVSAGLWALVLLHLGLGLAAEGGAFFTHSSPRSNESRTCFRDFTTEQHAVLLPLRLEMALLLFLLPLAVTAFCTLRCVVLVRRSCLPAGRKRRVVGVACATLAVFAVCYGPYNASHVVGFVEGCTVAWRKEAILSSTCNVFLEPVVMLLLSPPRLPGLAGRLCGRAGHVKTVTTRT
ncbi:free fatty acid receptor 3 [Conger conger]|uniref:free fatty acid receptor 3 n=1 Tax=Conger conger TaxID=82655 RepID=UPI002A5AD3E6|nr:free fatty acid receptor 3 [Conger conger]